MGCDGGTIPKRDELVKTKKKPEQKDKNSERAFRWKHCAISQQPLQKPVVACELGRLYNKEVVLETLLNKGEGVPDVAAHIRTLRDVKELQLTENPAWDKATSSNADVGDSYIDVQKSRWICPVSSQEMSGTFKFSFIWTCGCVLSDKALKEMRKANVSSSECLRCQQPFNFGDVIMINPTEEEDQAIQVERMNVRRSMAKKNKKTSRKREADAESSTDLKGETSTNGDVKGKEVSKDVSKVSSTEVKAGPSKVSTGLNGVAVKKSKLSTPDTPVVDDASKVKGYSVAKDPKASEAYKSLFTSHTSAQNQQKAHWVTYNPFYN